MLVLSALLLTAPPAQPDTVELRPGMVLTRSVVVRPGRYLMRPVAPDTVAIRVRGAGLTIDMTGVELAGTEEGSKPDAGWGIGVLVEGGRDIMVRGARIRGYKIGLLARGVRNFTLTGTDVSRNWRPRLWSGAGHESLVDWLYFHHNENDEWLRYGAGIFLIDVTGGVVRDNIAREGMNGLQMVRTERVRVWNNDFSYLSGLGIGLYRSSHNTIMHNRLVYCVRGYVHGVYRRGQDSAALLLYEQSSNNVVAYNSMTHSGDGVFLWAGQHTMDTGKGGANDNLFFGNDVSFAVANGIEATFSRNRFAGNLSVGSEYGVWGGYSWGSEFLANTFRRNVTGIAIEHGQDNLIRGNAFLGDTTAIRLWWNRIEPSDWGYPRHRDTRSRDHRIEANLFAGNTSGLRLENSLGVIVDGNQFVSVPMPVRATGDTTGFSFRGDSTEGGLLGATPWRPDTTHPLAPRPIAGGMMPEEPSLDRPGRESILVDEWGPWDGKRARLWPARVADSAYTGGPLTLRVLGSSGPWRVVGSVGVSTISDSGGVSGDTIVVSPVAGPTVDWRIELEGGDGRIAYQRFVAPVDWNVRAVAWDSTSDPRSRIDAFRARLAGPALAMRSDRILDYMWSRTRLPGFPAERFGVLAEGTVDLPPGEYELLTISDDGIRVWVDGQLAVDRWQQHESELEIVPLSAGRHALKVEYYQVGGWVELRVEVQKRVRSKE